jgi:hypothetical protein
LSDLTDGLAVELPEPGGQEGRVEDRQDQQYDWY